MPQREEAVVRSQEEKIRRMLYEIGRRMIEAIGRSNDVEGVVRQIHDEGYSLYLVLDGERDRQAQIELGLRTSRKVPPSPAPDRPLPDRSLPDRPLPDRSLREPGFRLNSDDVTFLKSLGIDPTRSPRRRSSSS